MMVNCNPPAGSTAPAAPPAGSADPGGGPPPGRHWGKFRGVVVDNIDLEGFARLLCEVPALPGMVENWAMPCVPYAGVEEGFFAIPPIGANVWVEFENGDPNYPIWTGCFWDLESQPVAPELSPEDPSLVKVFRSKFCTLIFNDTPGVGGITLSVIDPAVEVPVTLSMGPEGFAVNVGGVDLLLNPEEGATLNAEESVITVTPLAIEVEAPEISLTAEADVNLAAPEVSIEGETNITPVLTVEGDANVAGGFEVEGESNFLLAMTTEGEANFLGAVTAEGEVNVLGALTVELEANVLGALTVEGDVNILGAGQVEGNFAVLGIIEGVIVPPL